MRRLALLSTISGLLLTCFACGSDSTGGGSLDVFVQEFITDYVPLGDPEVETFVDKDKVSAGELFEASCTVVDASGTVNVETEVVFVSGDDEVVYSPGELMLEKVGQYDAACRTADGKFADSTPLSIEVTMGNTVKIETAFGPSEVAAGDTVEVTCTAFDAYGNSQEVTPGVESTPAAGLGIDGQLVTAAAAGTYELACIGAKGIDVTTGTLTVKASAPYLFTAAVTPDTVEAGQNAEVSCTVADVGGNLVEAQWVVEAPADVKVSGTTIHSTVADKYKIKCSPAVELDEVELKHADFTVQPGPAVTMLVYAKPVKDHYCLGDQLIIKHDLVDQYDNPVEEAAIEPIEVTPSGGLELQVNKIDKYNFVDEGYFTLKVQATDYDYSGQVDVVCDCTGPMITITYPPRGLTLSGPTSLVVTGHVEDKVSGVVSLTVNDEPVAVAGDGGFSHPMTMGHGMNLIAAQAQDGFDNTGKRFRSPFYSTAFMPADSANPVAAQIPEAIIVFLSQDFIDDGDHSAPPDDLATVVEEMLAGFDFASMLPEEGIPFMDNCAVLITNVQMGKPYVTLQSVDGGIHMLIDIPDFTADISLECCYELPFVGEYCDDYYGIIFAEKIVADAYIFVGVDADGTVNAELGPIEVDIIGLDVDIQGLVGGLFDPLVNLLVTVLKDTLITQLQEQYGQQLPQMIEEALMGLSEGQIIELPPLIGNGDPTQLMMSIDFHVLAFTYEGLYLSLDAALTADKSVDHTPSGSILRDGCMGTETEPFTLKKDAEMNAGLALDFGNEALYSIWYSGAITLDLTEEDLGDLDLTQYGLENLSIKTDLYYAPVLHTCGTGDQMELQVGDAFIHAKFFMMNMNWDIKIFLYLVLEASLSLVENEETGETEIGFQVGELKVAEVDVVEVGEDLKGKETMVEDLFAGVLIPTLMDQLLGGLGGFALPSFDLSTLADTIPAGTEISVDLQELAIDKGYLVVGGKLK